MEYNIEKIGQRLKLLRKAYGYTQDQAAEQLDIDRRHLSHLEKGTRGASIDLLLRIADLYGVSLDMLVTGQDRNGTMLKHYFDAMIRIWAALRDAL